MPVSAMNAPKKGVKAALGGCAGASRQPQLQLESLGFEYQASLFSSVV